MVPLTGRMNMPRPHWKPACEHKAPFVQTEPCNCGLCGQPFRFDGWHLTMHEAMARYQHVYRLRPIGPHRALAERLLDPVREDCRTCERRGLVTYDEAWRVCQGCRGIGGHWTVDAGVVEQIREQVLREFPDADAPRRPFWSKVSRSMSWSMTCRRDRLFSRRTEPGLRRSEMDGCSQAWRATTDEVVIKRSISSGASRTLLDCRMASDTDGIRVVAPSPTAFEMSHCEN